MAMFWPSIYPRSRSPCRNGSISSLLDEGEPVDRRPIRGTFFGCSALTGKLKVKSKVHRARERNVLLMGFFQQIARAYRTLLSALAIRFGGIVRPICLAVFKIDHQLKLHSLLHRQIGRLGTFQDLIDEFRGATVHIRFVGAVDHNGSGLDELNLRMYRRQMIFDSKVDDPFPMDKCDGVAYCHQGSGVIFRRGLEPLVNVFRGPDLKRIDSQSQTFGDRLQLFHCGCSTRIGRVQEHRHATELWNGLLKQFQSLTAQLGRQARKSGDVSARSCETCDDTRVYGIGVICHDDRYCACCLLRWPSRYGATSNDYVHFETHQCGCELEQAILIAFGIAVFNVDILSFKVAMFAQSPAERIDAARN